MALDVGSDGIGMAEVAIRPAAGCGQCTERGCGVAPLAGYARPVRLWCRDSLGVRAGQQVMVRAPEPLPGDISLACVAYGLPTLGLVAGGALAALLASALTVPAGLGADLADLVVCAGAVGGLLLGLLLGRRHERMLLSRLALRGPRQQARVIAILKDPDSEGRPTGRLHGGREYSRSTLR